MKALTFLRIVTIINLLVATGFSVAGMINPDLILPAGINTEKAITIFALYAGARTIPLLIVTIVSVINNRRGALVTLAFLAGTIQLLDGFIGIYQHDTSKSLGPFVIAIIQFVALYLTVKTSNSQQKIGA
jgi:hypothetical protein